MEHLFTNLETEKSYYIEFQVTSVKGLVGSSGLQSFNVFYFRPKVSVNLAAKNIDNAGIELSWYVRQIIFKNNNGVFTDTEKLDLTKGSAIADAGFALEQDFSLKLWLESPYVSNVIEQVDLLVLYGENGKIRLQYWDDSKFHLWKDVNGMKSHYATEVYIDKEYILYIQQIGDDLGISSAPSNTLIDGGKFISLNFDDINDGGDFGTVFDEDVNDGGGF